MEIKVKAAIGSPGKTVSVIDIVPDASLPEKVKTQIKRDVGDFLVESILETVHDARSPVKGEKWPKLSKVYKDFKEGEQLPGDANMEFSGSMLDSLEYKKTDKGIELGFFDGEAWKADGHLKFSGEENHTPKRRFLPDSNQEFIPEIQSEIEKIVADAIADHTNFKRQDFDGVGNRSELYDVLSEYFSEFAKTEIKAMVLRSPSMTEFLDDMGLLELL